MESPAKGTIITDTKSLHKDGVLHLQFSGDFLHDVKKFITKRGLAPGSVVLMNLLDRESKSYKQLRTIHLLIRIYDRFLQENRDDYVDIKTLKNEIKYRYGVIDYWEAPDGKVIATLKSFADYTLEEMAKVIDGLMEQMISNFAEAGYEDKRFTEMLKEFNNYEEDVKTFDGEIF